MDHVGHLWGTGQPLGSSDPTAHPHPSVQLSTGPTHQPFTPSWSYQPNFMGGYSGANYYLPPLPGYIPPTPSYPNIPAVTPNTQPASPPSPPTPLHCLPSPGPQQSPLGPSDPSGVADDQTDLANDIDLSRFTFSFQVWLELTKKSKDKKVKFENMRGRNVQIPLDTSFVNLSLHGFKRIIASCCRHRGYSCANTVLQCEREGKLLWLFHVNGFKGFRQAANVEVTTDEQFVEWIVAAAFAGQNTMGVQITMVHPHLVEGAQKISSVVRASLKRANHEFVASSDGNHADVEGSDEEDSDSDATLEEDADQALTTKITDIRAQLSTGRTKNGEVPQWVDPRDPRHIIAMTPLHLRVWAEDLLAKVPGVSISTPPLNRKEFKNTKRSGANLGALEPDADEEASAVKPHKSVLAGLSPHETRALALEVDAPITAFLEFAKIRDPELVAITTAQLNQLGIDSWHIFKSPETAHEMRGVGMLFGTIHKLIGAADAYETVLATRAINMQASGLGSTWM